MNNINGIPGLEEGILFKPVNLHDPYSQNFTTTNSTSGIVLEKMKTGNSYTTNFSLPGYTDQSANQENDLYKRTLKMTLAADKCVSENLSSAISEIVKLTMGIWDIPYNGYKSTPKLIYRVRDLPHRVAMQIRPGHGEYYVNVSPLMGKTSWVQFLYKVIHERLHAEYDSQGLSIPQQNSNVEKTIDDMAATALRMPWLKGTSGYIV